MTVPINMIFKASKPAKVHDEIWNFQKPAKD